MSSSCKAVYIIPAYNSGSRLGPVFSGVIRSVQREMKRNFSESAVLAVDNSSAKDNGATAGLAGESGAEILAVPQISGGYARCRGLEYAFKELNADVAFLGDDDGHHPPEGIQLLYGGIKNGADLVLGQRSWRDHLTHPLFQLALEKGFDVLAGILMLSPPADLVAGSVAFSKRGWNIFSRHLDEETEKKLKTAFPFFVSVYRALGLQVVSVAIPAPYEGDYLKDSLDPEFYRKRIKVIQKDYADLRMGLALAGRIRGGEAE